MPVCRSRPGAGAVRRAALATLAAGAWLAAAPPAAGQARHSSIELSAVRESVRLRSRGAMAREIAAAYPAGLRERGVTADVLLSFRVLPDGTVQPGSILLEHATDSAFVAPAMDVAGRLRFVTPEVLGRPTTVWLVFPIHFAPPPARAPAPADGTFDPWSVDELPGLAYGQYIGSSITKHYPPALRAAEVPGDLVMRFRIAADGTVDSSSVSVVQASSAGFAEAAAALVRGLRFIPAKVRGRPVASWFWLPLHFRVEPRPAPDEGTYELAAVEESPRVRNAAEVERMIVAAYPPALLASAVDGTVTLRFRVLANGSVDPATVQVVRASHPEFGAPAAEAAKRLRFTPARVGGRPVVVWVEVPISFHAPVRTPAPGDSAARVPR